MSDDVKSAIPVVVDPKDVATGSKDVAVLDPLQVYMREISKYKLLSPEEEKELTMRLFETGDIEVAKKLVVANLRLVVKIAMEYRKAHKNVIDLIQEGNLGLMKAVSKFDPTKGAKLSYYASWWIKSYILKFILDNFRLVKIGTTAEQKKLFYNLIRERDRLMAQGIEPTPKLISDKLNVSEKSVVEMERRLAPGSSDVSLDASQFDGDAGPNLHNVLTSEANPVEEEVALQQNLDILKDHLKEFLSDLNDRDKYIFQQRLLEEVPPSLQSIADEYGVSRERIRQIESRLLEKLKVYMKDHLR